MAQNNCLTLSYSFNHEDSIVLIIRGSELKHSVVNWLTCSLNILELTYNDNMVNRVYLPTCPLAHLLNLHLTRVSGYHYHGLLWIMLRPPAWRSLENTEQPQLTQTNQEDPRWSAMNLCILISLLSPILTPVATEVKGCRALSTSLRMCERKG